MNVDQLIEKLQADRGFVRNVTAWKVAPARAAQYADWPPALDARLTAALQRKGIQQLYTH